jgi:hypothetical protein
MLDHTPAQALKHGFGGKLEHREVRSGCPSGLVVFEAMTD